jgi:hypothetical protein
MSEVTVGGSGRLKGLLLLDQRLLDPGLKLLLLLLHVYQYLVLPF